MPALLEQAISLHRANRFQDANQLYQRILAIDPMHFDALQLSALLQRQIGNIEAALQLFDQALQIDRTNAAVFNNLGNTLRLCRRLEEALSSYDEAIRIKPDYAEAHNNRGVTLHELKRFDDALSSYSEATRVHPDYADAHWNKSLALLQLAEFAQGWPLYEWRMKKSEMKDSYYAGPQLNWRGQESISGKRLLVHCEQGLGDCIQFCRYLPMVLALGAEVIFLVPPSLLALFSTMPYPLTVVGIGNPLPEFDAYCPLMSLPLVFQTSLETIPAQSPYLFADAAKSSAWKNKLGKRNRLRVGIVWSGSSVFKDDSNRSMQMEQLLPLLELPIEWHSLQKDYRNADKQFMDRLSRIQDHQMDLSDFSDTAALLDAMDLIISVDTSVAHLAGAMGKPVWVLLPHVPDFRWLMDREDSPWYPSARLFRQDAQRDWRTVLERIKSELSTMLLATPT